MARNFSSSRIALAGGAIGAATYGGMAAIVRPTSTASTTISSVKGSAGVNHHFLGTNASGLLQWGNGTTNLTAPTLSITSSSGWVFVAALKPSGTAAVRFHHYAYATGTWSHEDSAATAANRSVDSVGSGAIGSYNPTSSSSPFAGDIAVVGHFFNRTLTDDQVEGMSFSMQRWVDLGPSALWILDQSATSQPVLDWTGGGANETALTGTTVSATSVPILSYGHPVLIATRESSGSTGTVAATLPALSAQATGGPITAPYVTGVPETFPLTGTDTITYTGGGTTGTGVYDVLCVNSDTAITTPSGWAPTATRVANQGAYIFTRPGGTTTATISFTGTFNTHAVWVRLANVTSIETLSSATAGADGSSGTATPSLSTGDLSADTDLLLAFAALHEFGTPPASPSWSSGYVQQAAGSTAVSGNGVYGNVAVKTPAGTASESPALSWTNATLQRYILAAGFTGAVNTATTGTVSAGLPALQAAAAGVSSSTASVAPVLPALTASAAGTSTATAAAGVGLPAVQAAAAGTASTAATVAVVLPALVSAVAGTASVSGTVGATLPALTISAAGTGTANAAVAAALPSLGAAVSGTASTSGTAAVTLPALQAAVVGDVAGVTSGGITAVLPALQASASGTASAAGTATVVLPALTATAAGQASAQGVAGLALPALQAAVVGGTSTVVAVAAIGLPALVAAANGTATTSGVIAATLPALTVSVSDAPVYTRRPGLLTAGTRRSRLTAGVLRGPTTGA